MLIDDLTLYEKEHFIIVNNLDRRLLYYFDYDERNFQVNMEFQHFHSFFEIMILLSDEAVHLIEGQPYKIHTNDIVMLAPSVFHKTIYPKGSPSKRIIISFLYPDDWFGMSDAYQDLLSPFYNHVPIYRFDYIQKKQIFAKLNQVFQFSYAKTMPFSAVDELSLHHKFTEFLYLIQNFMHDNIYQNAAIVTPSVQKIYDICTYIHNNFQEEISLDKLSKIFYLNPYYLSHQFKKVTAFTISNYIQKTRIKNAQYMLISSDEKISAIAEKCGFTSFSQFNRCFHAQASCSPRDFRLHGKIVSI